jgi:bifunctional DNA-binding transcriptional regulator/antitoxin component of YhaV-PrlF toxin-antitoxin module
MILHEFVVLDSAGRLQIPKELREEYGISRRAQMETREDGILIRPVEGESESSSHHLTLEEQIALLFQEPTPQGKKNNKNKIKRSK